MSDSGTAQFHWADYLVFSLSLGIGVVISIVSMLTSGKQKTTKDYLLGGGKMNKVMVGMSLLATAISATLLLGGSAEVHYR